MGEEGGTTRDHQGREREEGEHHSIRLVLASSTDPVSLSLSPHSMSAHAALIIPSPSTISFSSSCRSRPALDAKELIATLETIDELRRRDSAVSKDDSRIDYTSVLNIEDKKRRFSEDLVDGDTKSNIQMKKMYRQIQRQVHCDENTEV